MAKFLIFHLLKNYLCNEATLFNFLSRLINQEYDHSNPEVLPPQSLGPISSPFFVTILTDKHIKIAISIFPGRKFNPPTQNRIYFGSFFLGCGSNILRQYHINGQI